MRGLMDRWKEVPRTGRDGDDDLWKQFRAAQDVFFEARSQSDKQRTDEELANQKLKEEILAEAEKLDVSGDLRGAQNALRKLQERYDAVGHVPRGVMRSLEDRMQAVEQKVRGAADTSRARTAPENPMVTSMRAAVTKAEEQLAKAEAAGDKARIQEAKANLATRQEWLAEAEKAATRRSSPARARRPAASRAGCRGSTACGRPRRHRPRGSAGGTAARRPQPGSAASRR